jgi:hypothetical protein
MTQPVYYPAREEPRPPQRPLWLWIIALVAALVVGFALGAAVGVESRGAPDPANASTDSGEPAASAIDTRPPTTTTTTRPPMPTPQDFTITIKVIRKQCFGSAGCNLTYQIEPKYIGTTPLPDEKITVVYEITGGDEPQINRFTVEGDTASFDEEEHIQTPKSSSELTATVTEII